MKLFRTYHNLKRIRHVFNKEERYVALQLMKSFSTNEYAVLNNVLIPCSSRVGTSQIDHIVISTYGIFCIETKSHAGWIFGSKAREIFTQVLWKKKYRIQPNPVSQNATHIKALRELLGVHLKVPIISIVVFPSADRFFIDGYENVGSMNDLFNTIKNFSDRVYLYREAKQIIETICAADMRHADAHAHHVHSIKAVHASQLVSR